MPKPRIGQTVYIIYDHQIIKEVAGYIGKDSFIIEDFNLCYEDAREWFYEEFGKTWFKSLKSAKDYLKVEYPNCKIVNTHERVWGLR